MKITITPSNMMNSWAELDSQDLIPIYTEICDIARGMNSTEKASLSALDMIRDKARALCATVTVFTNPKSKKTIVDKIIIETD